MSSRRPLSIKPALRRWPDRPIASCVYCGQHCAVIDGALSRHCSTKFYQCPRVGLRVNDTHIQER